MDPSKQACKRKLDDALERVAEAKLGEAGEDPLQQDSPKPSRQAKKTPPKAKAQAKGKAKAAAKKAAAKAKARKANAKATVKTASPVKPKQKGQGAKNAKKGEREKSFARRWRPDGEKASIHWQCLRDTFNSHVRSSMGGQISKMEDDCMCVRLHVLF